MSEQLDILGGAKPLTRPAPRQDAVLALLRAHPEGCSADEIGAAIHGASGRHPADSVCKWCDYLPQHSQRVAKWSWWCGNCAMENRLGTSVPPKAVLRYRYADEPSMLRALGLVAA